MRCQQCHQPIPAERLAAVPDATHCVPCLQAAGDPRKRGRMIYDHKTAGAIEVLSPQQFKSAVALDPRGGYSRRAGEGSQEEKTEKSKRIPSDPDCRKLLDELDWAWDELDAFERNFITSNRERTSFTNLQKLVCRRMAKTYDLKAWKP